MDNREIADRVDAIGQWLTRHSKESMAADLTIAVAALRASAEGVVVSKDLLLQWELGLQDAGFLNMARDVRATLAAAPADKEPAPDSGSVVVPREPTEAMVDAPRQIILYACESNRTLEGLRAHLVRCGVDYLAWFPVWATRECGHLNKATIAILIYYAMLAAHEAQKEGK